jgi:hypothetical protein
MSRFGGYTVDTLLAEPASTFFRLLELADRTLADEALDVIFAGVAAAFGGHAKDLLDRRGKLTIKKDVPTFGSTAPTKEEQLASIYLHKEYLKTKGYPEPESLKKYDMNDLKKQLGIEI